MDDANENMRGSLNQSNYMCGRIVNALGAEEIRAECNAQRFYDVDRFRANSFNIGPTRYCPVLVGTNDIKSVDSVVSVEAMQREAWSESVASVLTSTEPSTDFSTESNKITKYVRCMRWGLVPHYTTKMPEYADTRNTINARDDTILSGKGMWQSMKNNKRSIIPIQGFYEWQKISENARVPHLVQLPEVDGKRPLMMLAGLWDKAKIQETALNSFTIITTHPNKQLEFLHDRMPVILQPDDIDQWLDPNLPFEKVAHLLRPYPHALECIPVTSYVGNVKNDGVECIRKATEQEVAQMKAGKKVKVEAGQQSITSFFQKSPATTPKRKRDASPHKTQSSKK